MKLISHCLTPGKRLSGILSLIRFSNLSAPSQFSALPPVIYSKASPKAISERTSYLQVRLEFLRYPQVIQALFNVPWFGPPVSFTSPSTCSWVGHMVSGLRHNTIAPYSDSVSLRLRLFNLTSHHIVTRRFILQKARHHPLTGSVFL